jgi:signal transduction histidine kinase
MHPLSLIVLCREAIEATRFSTYEENLRGCEIKESIASNIVIIGNLEQLIQVFVNLIKNAYEAMWEQKERKIEIRGDVDPENPKMARIDFEDNGPGIPPDVITKIWLQGFSTKERKDDSIGAAGQGQGLFVVKHMIESIHKGTITAESTVGEGTTFIMRLPLAEAQE